MGQGRPRGQCQSHQEFGQHQARAGHGQAVQVHHHRQVLPPRSTGLRSARLADDHPGYAHRRPVRQERAGVPRRAGHHRNRPDPDPVRRSRPYRREHLEGPDVLQRRHQLGCLRARRGRPCNGYGSAGCRARRRTRLRLPTGGAGRGRLPQVARARFRHPRKCCRFRRAPTPRASSRQQTWRA